MGTTAYRNEVYNVAAAHWQNVIDSPVKLSGDEEFKAMALGTITFLTYHGLGVKQDRIAAVRNWKQAVRQGDLEARRHLGEAYADEKFKEQDLIKALGWYESIFMLFSSADKVPEDDQSIYQDAKQSSEKLKHKLSESQIKNAMQFAKSTLRKYPQN